MLHHTCVEDAKQLLSTFNHALVSINAKILLRAVIWNNAGIFAHICGADNPQS